MVLNGLAYVSRAELWLKEPFSQQLLELLKHSETYWYAGPLARSAHFSARGQHEQSSRNFWNGRITDHIKIEEKQDARSKASEDMDIVNQCGQALSRWNEKVMCVCLCVGWVGVGWGWKGAAVSNGSCLTGKRSICYNVNNDPSSYCAARDKSIKDPSCPIITILCQQPAEGLRVMEREKTLRKWRWIPEAALSTELLCRTVVLIVAGNGPSQSSASHFFLFCSILSGTHLLVICYGRFAAQWNLSGVERSPCCCIDYPLTKRYRQMHSDISEIISEMVFLVTNYTRGRCHSNSTLWGKVRNIWILHLWDK